MLFEYEPSEKDELRLTVGDTILNVVVVEDGWMRGTLNGKTGMFPDNFVELLESATETDAAPAGKNGSATVYDHIEVLIVVVAKANVRSIGSCL